VSAAPARTPARQLEVSTSLGTSDRDLLHHVADSEARRLGARREVLEALNELADDRLRRHEKEGPVRHPVGVPAAVESALVGIAPQISYLCSPQLVEALQPDIGNRL